MSAYQVNFFKTLLRSDGHAHQLSDDQLHTVMKAYAPLDPSKRSVLMERVAAQLRQLAGCRRPSDGDVELALRAAMAGLRQTARA
jgi:hypothetical protein